MNQLFKRSSVQSAGRDRLISAKHLHLSVGIVLLRLFPKQPPTVADVICKRWNAALFQSSFFIPICALHSQWDMCAVASPPMRKRRPATYCIRPLFQQEPSTPMIQPKRMMATAMPMKPAVILLRSEKTSQRQLHFLSNLCRRKKKPTAFQTLYQYKCYNEQWATMREACST